MEKSAEANVQDESKRLPQQPTGDWKQPHSLEDIRRQLGWGLVAWERKGTLR
jgi:hypothetical protein